MKTKKNLILTIMLCLLGRICGYGQESKLQALFMAKFAEYVKWPDDDPTIDIGVLGSSEVTDELKKFTASRSSLSVSQISDNQDVNNVNILYIPFSQKKRSEEFFESVGSKPILVITDQESTVGEGSDIGFYTESDRLKFAISPSNIERKQMTPSSKLLTLGKKI